MKRSSPAGVAILTLVVLSAVAILIWELQGSPATAADRDNLQEDMDRIRYGAEYHAKYREVTYWGIASLTIRDYKPGSGDARRLGLVRQEGDERFPREYPSTRLQQYFMKEFKRVFGSLPFHDVTEGRDARWGQYFEEHKEGFLKGGLSSALSEKWGALEEARRRSLYGGRAGAIHCYVAVQRATFPVLYEMACDMSADEKLRPYFQDSVTSTKDIGFSSPDHAAGEIEKGLSAMLEDLSNVFAKIRKYGPPRR